jgi:hypothetical protein
MHARVLAALILTGSLVISAPTQAATIVDTGPATAAVVNWGLVPDQWLAAEFTTSQAWEITDVQGWIVNSDGGDVALHTDDVEVPGTELFSQPLIFLDDSLTARQ